MIANGQTLSTGLFLRALKKLNSKLRVCSFDNSNRLAGLYLLDRGEWEDICGVDKKYVPAYTTFDDGGHVIKSGWRRVFWILVGNGYTTVDKIRRVCPGFFDSRARAADKFTGGVSGDPVDNKIQQFMLENLNRGEELPEVLSTDQILEVSKLIHAKDTLAQREERDHDVWFLEKWKQNGGGVKDRPNY